MHVADLRMTDLLSARAVAALRGVDRATVRTAIASGELPSHQQSKSLILVRREDALAWTPRKRGQSRKKAASVPPTG